MARFRRLLTVPIILLGGLLLVGCEDEDLPTAQGPSQDRKIRKKKLQAAPKAPATEEQGLTDDEPDGDEPADDEPGDDEPADDDPGDGRVVDDPGAEIGPREGETKPKKKEEEIAVTLPGAAPFAPPPDPKDGPNGKGEKLGGRKAGPKRTVRLPTDTELTVQQAIDAIKKAKGRIEKNDEGQVVKVFLNRTEIGDAGLRPVKYLPTVEVLNITGTSVSDAGLVYLKGLSNLKHLYPDRTEISDDGIASLKESLPNLMVLE